MERILCFGDSNTWGYEPLTAARFPMDVRWPGVMRNELGEGFFIIEEGLNGRTTVWDDPMGDHWNGREYFIPCLDTHRPVELVILMLGTNDLKNRFALSAWDIAYCCGKLVDICLNSIAGPDGGPPKVLLISPAHVLEVGPFKETLQGAEEKSRQLASYYEPVAAERGVEFLDAARIIQPSELDGIHFAPDQHEKLGKAVAAKVRTIV